MDDVVQMSSSIWEQARPRTTPQPRRKKRIMTPNQVLAVDMQNETGEGKKKLRLNRRTVREIGSDSRKDAPYTSIPSF